MNVTAGPHRASLAFAYSRPLARAGSCLFEAGERVGRGASCSFLVPAHSMYSGPALTFTRSKARTAKGPERRYSDYKLQVLALSFVLLSIDPPPPPHAQQWGRSRFLCLRSSLSQLTPGLPVDMPSPSQSASSEPALQACLLLAASSKRA